MPLGRSAHVPIRPEYRCADWGVVMILCEATSYYFGRPLCLGCFAAETYRSKDANEIFVLEQLYRRSVA